jgi:cytochrome c554/c'-like protein
MRRTWAVLGTVLVGAWALAASHSAWAFPAVARETKLACEACHANPAGGPLNDAGKAYEADHAKVPTSEAKAVDYVSTNKCKMCHAKQYKAWQTTEHAHALKSLETAGEKEIADRAAALKVELKGHASESNDCLLCHTTGFHLPGGYPAADSTKSAALANVTCESCHGPGGKHVTAPMADKKKTIFGAPTEKMCRQCHTPEMSPKFNFEEYHKKGVHQVAKAE